MLHSFPKAIIHIDGDCFFASCEVAKDPSLKGKPVVTGRERGIASSLTYEAKAKGVKRGMQIREILKVCPDAIILPSDYETYSLYSKRMFEIVRRYTPDVEEYSIDECFADITGCRAMHKMSYVQIAEAIKKELDEELGMTFSIGLSVNKVTAKIGSKWKKPDGLTAIPGHSIHLFLEKLTVDKVWGIGPNTTEFLNRFGIHTTLQFALCSEEWIRTHLRKPQHEIWRELRGDFIYKLDTREVKHDYQSISKTKTFTPPSKDRSFVLSQLSKNIENACIKLRRHNLVTNRLFFMLRKQDLSYGGLELKLTNYTDIPIDIIRMVSRHFDEVYKPGVDYRATGIVLMNLRFQEGIQMDLFGPLARVKEISSIFKEIDKVAGKYGKHAVFLGSSFQAMKKEQHKGDRGVSTERRLNLFKGETKRRHLNIPTLGRVK
jgi:DNA polymerase-4/DNA polymerase V